MLTPSMAKRNHTRRPGKDRNGDRERRNRSFDLLWGSKARPSRGPKPELSVDTIVRAAVHVADAESLSAVTMTSVATQLDVTTMALYRYVPGKDDLVDLMIDAALGEPPDAGGRDWRTEVGVWARASLALFQARPWLLESVMRRAPIGPNWLAWLNAAFRALSDSGLTASEMVPAVMLIDGHVRSSAQVSLGATGTGEWAENFARVLQSSSSEPRYAALASVASAGGFDRSSQTPFEFGLQRLLDGIDVLIRARAPKRLHGAAERAGSSRPRKRG